MRGSTIDQLRHDIDSGRTGDKAPGFDLAVAPLGTDDEAAGTPVSAEVVGQLRAAEMAAGLKSTFAPDKAPTDRALWFAIGVGISAAAVAVAVVIA